MGFWTLLLWGWTAVAVLMAAMWLAQLKTKNAGIVDVIWTLGVGLLGGFFAWGSPGLPARRFLVAALAGVWAARLAMYLFQRLLRESEDGRYRQLREQWGESFQRNMFIFFQVQATWSVLFAAPMLMACFKIDPLGWLDYVGVGIWAVSIGGEATADKQLQKFKAKPDNKGKVCRRGLWRYSRHPNYFFEWLHWWAYVAIAWGGPYGWASLMGPAVMLVFLTKITGIPPTEANALRSRGEAYREYQRTTSAFFPWPPKESAA